MSRPANHEPILQTPARPKGEKRRRGGLMVVFVLATLAVLAVVPFLLLRPRETLYLLRSFETATVEQGTLLEYRRATGALVPRVQRSLLAPGEGVLAEWLVAAGDEVSEGTPLGRLSSPQLQDEVRVQQGALSEAQRAYQALLLEQQMSLREGEGTLLGLQNALADAQRTVATTERLFDIGASSQAELETARAAEALARGALATAEANGGVAAESQTLAQNGALAAIENAERALAAAREQVGALELLAPLSGRVLALKVNAGDTVQAGALLATLASQNELRVEANLSEAQTQGVGVGQRAIIAVAGESFEGTVMQVAAQAQAGEGGGAATVPVLLSFDTASQGLQGLRIGASAAVAVEVGRRENALYLPRGPYLTTGGERLAYVVSSDGERAERQTVRFGLVDGERVELADGLSAGQRVVTSSYEAFKDRAAVRLAPEGEIK